MRESSSTSARNDHEISIYEKFGIYIWEIVFRKLVCSGGKDYKNLFQQLNNFKCTCKLFLTTTIQTKFLLKLDQTESYLHFNVYLKLLYLLQLSDYPNRITTHLLSQSCEKGFSDVILPLISDYGANVNAKLDFKQGTPLIIACRYGNAKTVQELLKIKDLDLNETTFYGITALMAAVEADQQEVVYLLLSQKDKFDVNFKNPSGNTALDRAKKNSNIFKILQKEKKFAFTFPTIIPEGIFVKLSKYLWDDF